MLTDYTQHKPGCARVWPQWPAGHECPPDVKCTCGLDADLAAHAAQQAALEAVVGAAEATQDTKDRFGGCPFCMRVGTHDDWCQIGKLKATLDRLNALGGTSEKEASK